MTDIASAEAVPGVGHNMETGLPSVDEINIMLEANNVEALKRVEALVAKAPDFYTITSDDDDSKATEFMVKSRARWKASEADRVADKAPYDDRASAVQQFYKTKILDRLADIGKKINDAQTAFKVKKAEDEKKAREAEAKRLRQIEDDARQAREAEEKRIRDEEDRLRREREAAEKSRRDEEDRLRRIADEEARKKREESERLAAEAARKRNVDNKAVADAAAEKARKAAAEEEEKARLERERIAKERAERDEADRLERERLEHERMEREEANRLEENRLAEERAVAEENANVSLADLSRNRGEKGGVSSLKQSVSWRDVNRTTLDYGALGPYFSDKHLDTALKGYSDANKALVQTGIKTGNQPLKGVVFFLEAKSQGRA